MRVKMKSKRADAPTAHVSTSTFISLALAWILNDAKGFQVNTLGEFFCLVILSCSNFKLVFFQDSYLSLLYSNCCSRSLLCSKVLLRFVQSVELLA